MMKMFSSEVDFYKEDYYGTVDIILGIPAFLLGQVAVRAVVLIDIYLTNSPLNNGAPPGHPARVRGDDVVSPSM